MTDPILRVEGLAYAPGDGFELHCDGFEIRPGERTALVGPNGAGKTTTLRCIARLAEGWSGSVELFGRSVKEWSRRELARKIACVSQRPAELSGVTARRAAAFGRTPYLGLLANLTEEDEAAVAEALDRAGALRFAHRRIETLSGGERQKVIIASAFAQNPALLLLDEAGTFLDLRSQEEISDAIRCYLADKGAGALETTHDINRAAAGADRVVALRGGRQVFSGSARESTSLEALERVFGRTLTTAVHPTLGVPMVLPDAPAELRRENAAPVCEEPSLPEFPKERSGMRLALAILAFATLCALFFLPLLGRTSYSWEVWLDYPTGSRPLSELPSISKIFWGERLPKTLLAAFAGGGLALAGLALQTLFRNPLATPYTLGIASGSSFGATLSIFFSGWLAERGFGGTILGVPFVVWSSAAGAALATGLVSALSHRARSQERVLLSGVVIGFFFSSLVLCGQYLANPTKTHAALRWTTGSLDLCEPRYLVISGVATLLGALALTACSRSLDALTLGEDRARALGVDADRMRRLLFAISSALVGVIVAFCGPIGFVGLTAPHIARLFFGTTHRALTPAACLTGAIFLAACYTFARTVFFPASLPVGIVTSLLGGPFFLWLLVRKR